MFYARVADELAFPALQQLALRDGRLQDISFLSRAQGLRKLNFLFCRELRNIAVLTELHELRSISLQCSDVQDLKPLAVLSDSLRELNLRDCSSVQDISALSGLEMLRELDLIGTRVVDIEPLRRLSRELVKLLLP